MLSLHWASNEDDAAAAAIQQAADSGSDVLELNYLSDMQEIPISVKLLRDQLEVLCLDNNYALTSLPTLLGDLPKLRHLDASYCSLTAVSPALCRLSRLTQLKLSNNRLTFLPSEISQLKRLEELHLDNNKLTALPGGLVFLPKLRELTIENNPLYTPEKVEGAAGVTLVPPQISVDCASCCVRVRNYRVSVSFHRLPSFPKAPLPFVFFVCSEECEGHLANRLAQHDARMKVE